MQDEMFTRDNVIAVTFPEEANAYEALARLKELDSQGTVGVRGAAVVAREDDGRIAIKDQLGGDSFEDTVGGGLLGLLVGVLGGPLGVLIGGATGVLIGSLFDGDDDDDTRSVLGEISSGIRVGPPGLLAEVSELDPAAVDAVMAHLNGTVVRRSGFHARDAHLVLSPGAREPIPFRVLLDGEAPGPSHGLDVDDDGNGTLREGRLYQLVRQHDAIRERTLEITFLEAGAEAYVFTFG